MFDPNVLNWISWIGFVATIVGLVLTLIGLVLTYQQASKAREAAINASQKADEALRVVKSRTRLSALSSAVSQTDVIINLIKNNQMVAGRAFFTSFRRDVQEAIIMTQESNDQSRKDELAAISNDLSEITKYIDSQKQKQDAATIKTLVLGHMRSVSDFLIHEESIAKSELK